MMSNTGSIDYDKAAKDRVAYLKSRRSHARAAVTRAMTAVQKLVTSKDNLLEVKLRMVEFQNILEDFAKAHEDYYMLLIDESVKHEAEIYRKQFVEIVNSFIEYTSSWIESMESSEAHVSVSEVGRQSQVSTTLSALNEARAKARAEKAALVAEIEGLIEQKALEKEQFELRRIKHLKELEIEKQRFQSELELEMQKHDSKIELGRQELELEHRRRELHLSAKLAKADAVQKVYSDVIDSDAGVRFTHSTPEDIPLPKVSQPRQEYFATTPTNPAPKPVGARLSWEPSAVRKTETQVPNVSEQASELTYAIRQMLIDSRTHQQSLVEAMQLPKNELPTFDGDPLKYWSFIRAFNNTVDKKSTDDGARLVSLFQFCTGKAKKLIQCCMIKEPAEGYLLAKKLLKERFGNDDIIAQAWIDKIVNRQDVKNSIDLQDYADDLRCCQETLVSMGYISEMENRRSLCLIADKLPSYLKTRWLKKNYDIKSDKKRNPRLDDMILFITSAAREANDPIFGKLVQREKRGNTNDKRKPKGSFSIQSKPVTLPETKKRTIR